MPHSNRTKIAIALHSGYGHTAVVAEAVARGAAGTGAEVVSIPVDTITDEQWAQLDGADAIIFGAATYMGTASAAFHEFAEASSKRWFSHAWGTSLPRASPIQVPRAATSRPPWATSPPWPPSTACTGSAWV